MVPTQTSIAPEDAALVGEVAAEFFDRIARGEHPDVEQYAQLHPEIAEVIREMFPTLDLLKQSTNGNPSTNFPTVDARDLNRLGDYEILGELGRGGMGVVYEAQQISLNRRVALKVLPFAAMMDPKQLTRFKNEAQAAAGLDHPNIVDVYAVGCERSVHFYAMRYIQGQTVAQLITELRLLLEDESRDGESASQQVIRIARDLSQGRADLGKNAAPQEGDQTVDFHGVTPPAVAPAADTRRDLQAAMSTHQSRGNRSEFYRNVASLGIQAASALDFAHGQGILHRDVKPGNLMVDEQGKLWVTDFGLARIESEVGMTMTGDMLGTLRYMSPEQALAQRVVVDHRSDIYSLGVTLYEMLSLQPAYAMADRQALLKQIAFDLPPRLRQLDRRIPPELETIVGKAIEKNPEDRYATAQELADDLQRYLDNEPIRATPPTPVQRLAKWSRRHVGIVWMGMAAAIVIALVLLVSTSLVAHWYGEANAQRSMAQNATRSAKREAEAARLALAAEAEAHSEARQNLYRAHMREAHEALQRGHVSRAESLLYKYIPKSDEMDYRGWEWYYVLGQLDGGSEIIDCHPSNVRSIRFSSDGRLFASVSSDHVRLWEASTRKRLRELHIPYGLMKGASFSPDGRTLAISSADGVLRLWPVGEPGALRTLQSTQVDGSGSIGQLAWSPGGTKIATTIFDGVVIWDVERGIETRRISLPREVCVVAWSPNGEELAVGTTYGWLRLLDATTGKERIKIEAHGHNVWSIDWTSDGSKLATGAFDQHVKIFDAETGKTLQDFVNPSGVDEVRLSPDDQRLACATAGQEIRIWDVNTGELDDVRVGHRGWVVSLGWSLDGKEIISGGADRTVRMWKMCKSHPLLNADSAARIFHFDRSLGVLTTDHKDLQVYDYENEKVLFSTAGNRAQWNRTGERLAVQDDTAVRILDGKTGAERASFVLPEGHRLTAGGDPGDWRSQEGGWRGNVAWSEDDQMLATTNGSEVRIWNTATGSEQAQMDAPGFVLARWSPRDNLLAMLANSEIQVWDALNGVLLARFRDDQLYGTINNVVWSPDGARIATAGWAGKVKLWEAHSGRLLHELVGHVPNRFVRTIAWSRDGSLLASGGWDQSVKIWDTLEGREIRTLDAHTTNIHCVAFAPNSQRLASSDWSGAIKLWDVATGEELLTLEEADGDSSKVLIWSSDGSTLWSCSTSHRDGEGGLSLFDGRPRSFDAKHGFQMARSGELDAAIARNALSQGIRLARSGRIEESNQDFAEAERRVGTQAWAHRERAWIFHKRGMEVAAERDLEVAANSASGDPIAQNELARLLTNRSDDRVREPVRAEQMARELIADWPQQGRYWTTLGLALYRQGKWQEAIDAVETAEQLRPHEQMASLLIQAMSRARLGQTREAKQSLESVAELWEDFVWVQTEVFGNIYDLTIEDAEQLRQEAERLLQDATF